jgi:hypothetical protein
MSQKVYQVKLTWWAGGCHASVRAETGLPQVLYVNVPSSFDIPRKLLEFLADRDERFLGTVPATDPRIADLCDYFLISEPNG